MFGLSVAVAAGAMAIESANVVGYSTKAAEQGKFIILGAQFDQVDGSKALNGLITGVEGVAYDDDNLFQTTAAQVQIPSANGYDTYYYLSDGWYDDNGSDGYKAGWCNGYGVLVDAELIPGVAMWLKSVPGNATANVAGAVPEDSSVDVACPVTFALRANAFPMPIALNSSTMTSANIIGVAYDDNDVFRTTAPQIQIPSANGYDTYYYLTDGWYDDHGADGYKAGWCNGYGVLVDAEIPVAQGFWTKGVTGAFTLTFTK